MAEPTWGRGEAFTGLNKAAAAYKDALKSVATGLAQQEKAERVLVRHVQDAERILEAAGKSRRKWYQRHEFEITLGGIAIGYVPSAREMVTACAGAVPWLDKTFVPALSNLGTLTLLSIGIALIVHGWLRVIGVFGEATFPSIWPANKVREVSPTPLVEPPPIADVQVALNPEDGCAPETV